MAGGGKKKRLREKLEAAAQRRSRKTARLQNPSGGSKYAKKGDIPAHVRIANEEDRREKDALKNGPGEPVDETFLGSSFDDVAHDDDPFSRKPGQDRDKSEFDPNQTFRYGERRRKGSPFDNFDR